MRLNIFSASSLCLAFSCGVIIESSGSSALASNQTAVSYLNKDESDRIARQIDPGNESEADIQRLIALRTRPLDELLTLANQLERKWRRRNWNHYAQVMKYVCSEISNRGLNDAQVREQRRHFARIALSFSHMYLWEHEAALVGALGYERPADDNLWLRERRETTGFWLRAWRRFEKEFDPSYDPNDRTNNISLRVYPPFETGLPPGTPPYAIKNPKLRAQYEAAIAENQRKSKKAFQQIPLIRRGPSFKARAEYVLIYMYSRPPFRNTELKRYLESSTRDARREREFSMPSRRTPGNIQLRDVYGGDLS